MRIAYYWSTYLFVQKFAVKESEVHNALLSGDPHDQLGIAYHLVIDNKRIADEAAKAELKDFYVASSPPPVQFEFSPSPVRPHPERIARKLFRCNPFFLDNAPKYLCLTWFSATFRSRVASIDRGSQGDAAVRSAPVKRAKWHLGKKPSLVHILVFNLLESNDCISFF